MDQDRYKGSKAYCRYFDLEILSVSSRIISSFNYATRPNPIINKLINSMTYINEKDGIRAR